MRSVPPPLPPLGKSPGPARTWPRHRASHRATPVTFKKLKKKPQKIKKPQKSDRVIDKCIKKRGKFTRSASSHPIHSIHTSFHTSSNHLSQTIIIHFVYIIHSIHIHHVLALFHPIILFHTHISVSRSSSSHIIIIISQHRITTQRILITHASIKSRIKSLCHVIIFAFCFSVAYLGRKWVALSAEAAITLSKNDITGKRWHTKRSWQLVSGTGACTLRCCCHFPRPTLATTHAINAKDWSTVGANRVLIIFHRYRKTSVTKGIAKKYGNGYIGAITTSLHILEHDTTLTNRDRYSDFTVGSWCHALAGSLRVYYGLGNCLSIVAPTLYFVKLTLVQSLRLHLKPLVLLSLGAPLNKQHVSTTVLKVQKSPTYTSTALSSSASWVGGKGELVNGAREPLKRRKLQVISTVLKVQKFQTYTSMTLSWSASWLAGKGELVSGARGSPGNLRSSRRPRCWRSQTEIGIGPKTQTIGGVRAGNRSTKLKAETVVGQEGPGNDTHHYPRWAGCGVGYSKGPYNTNKIPIPYKKLTPIKTQDKLTPKDLTILIKSGSKVSKFLPLLTPTVDVVYLQCTREEGGRVSNNNGSH